MQGVKLVLADGVWWRCGIDFDLSKVVGVQFARVEGEDLAYRVTREIPQEAIHTFHDAMKARVAANSGPQSFYLESE